MLVRFDSEYILNDRDIARGGARRGGDPSVTSKIDNILTLVGGEF